MILGYPKLSVFSLFSFKYAVAFYYICMTKKALEAKDLFPSSPSFFLAATGKEHLLRKINVQDYAWMQEKTPDLDARLSKGQIEFGLLCKLLFRLLEDKSCFLPIDEENVYDDEGEIVEKRRVSGPDRLARSIEMSELEAVTKAFNVAMGLRAVEAKESSSEEEKKRQ